MDRDSYDTTFYTRRDAGTRASARALLGTVRKLAPFESVVDVGCGVGTWLAVAMEEGASTIRGVEGPWLSPERLVVPAEFVRTQDLGEPVRYERRFDLAICLEVAEHLPERSAGTLVDSLVSLSPVVLFSAAVPFQGGRQHVNEQWPEYWAERFASKGYRVADAIRPAVWSRPDVRVWYAQNALVFVDEKEMARWPALADSVARTDPRALARVHPALYERNSDRSRLSLRTLLRLIPRSLSRALRRRLPGNPANR